VKQLGEVPQIEEQIRNKRPFEGPANGELTAEMVSRFVKVQETMSASLGAKVNQLKEKYDQLEQARKAERREASMSEGLGALKDLAGVYVDAKRAQVDALNQAGFSLAEYDWVRKQVYAAAGLALAQINIAEIGRSAQAGRPNVSVTEASLDTEIPAHNQELVKPYAEKLKDWMPMAFFGL
jgi:hypothetical protein